MVRIGLVGIGFMGWIHYLGYRHVRDAQLVALCSKDPKKRAGDWTGIRGNFGPPGEQVDLSGVRTYETLDEMLADPNIDMVDICNPTGSHPETAIKAMQAGKHVLVEKAIALTAEDADRMLAVAKETGKLLMVAHVLPFMPEFRFAAEAVQDGRYGKLLAGHFTRVISKPDWSADIADAGQTGGPAIDLHIHDTHFIGLLCGKPTSVQATGVVENGLVVHLTTAYNFGGNGPAITCTSGWLCQGGRPFVHGFELFFEQATLKFDSECCPLKLITSKGAETVTLAVSDDPSFAFGQEVQMAVAGIQQNQTPHWLSGQLARDALVMCYRECDSVLQKKEITL
ncbi:MAG: Gfo/Idh/MocA family oxidoreductase [Zavarzinella sp.]